MLALLKNRVMQMINYSEFEYLNLSEICESHKKYIYHYKANKQTDIFLKNISSETNIPIEKLIHKKEISGKSYYFAHPIIGHHFREWCKKERKLQREEEIKMRLQEELGGEIEVATNTGAIDILTEKEIIEVKSVKNWIHGVGQLMVRGQDYPQHSKRLHLFGKFSTKSRTTQYLQLKNLELIQKYCIPLGITITWEE
jgi:YHS domain-containing protein